MKLALFAVIVPLLSGTGANGLKEPRRLRRHVLDVDKVAVSENNSGGHHYRHHHDYPPGPDLEDIQDNDYPLSGSFSYPSDYGHGDGPSWLDKEARHFVDAAMQAAGEAMHARAEAEAFATEGDYKAAYEALVRAQDALHAEFQNGMMAMGEEASYLPPDMLAEMEMEARDGVERAQANAEAQEFLAEVAAEAGNFKDAVKHEMLAAEAEENALRDLKNAAVAEGEVLQHEMGEMGPGGPPEDASPYEDQGPPPQEVLPNKEMVVVSTLLLVGRD